MTQFSTLIDDKWHPIPLEVIFSAKRKRSIGMTINAKWVTVRAPKRCSQKLINQFIEAKRSRIVKKRAHQQEQAEVTTIDYDDNGIPLAVHHLGKHLPIYLRMHEKKRPAVEHNEQFVTMVLPQEWITTPQEYAQQMQKALEKWQRVVATDYLTHRTRVLNDELWLNVWNIIIKSYKRKYWQCKWREISLDWKLIRFPVSISDHIIYHELTHLTHKHHQKSFRDLLKTYDPKTVEHNKRLKHNGPAMHSDW